jgi:hypothetical protein
VFFGEGVVAIHKQRPGVRCRAITAAKPLRNRPASWGPPRSVCTRDTGNTASTGGWRTRWSLWTGTWGSGPETTSWIQERHASMSSDVPQWSDVKSVRLTQSGWTSECLRASATCNCSPRSDGRAYPEQPPHVQCSDWCQAIAVQH